MRPSLFVAVATVVGIASAAPTADPAAAASPSSVSRDTSITSGIVSRNRPPIADHLAESDAESVHYLSSDNAIESVDGPGVKPEPHLFDDDFIFNPDKYSTVDTKFQTLKVGDKRVLLNGDTNRPDGFSELWTKEQCKAKRSYEQHGPTSLAPLFAKLANDDALLIFLASHGFLKLSHEGIILSLGWANIKGIICDTEHSESHGETTNEVKYDNVAPAYPEVTESGKWEGM